MPLQDKFKSLINRQKLLLLPAIIAIIFYSCSADKKEKPAPTYCNPINIDYTYSNVNTSKGLSYRSGADPACVKFKGEYYLFVTRSFGYWHSKDLLKWDFIHPQSWYFESSNAPAAWSYKDSILIAMGNPSGWQCVIYTDDPKKGTWKGVPSLIPIDIHDPALFVDDDSRVYLYIGSSNVFPIKGVELDPSNYFLPEGEIKDLLKLHPKEHGWERFGENHSDTTIKGFMEGAWMTKYNNKYYLQYASTGNRMECIR
jgi:xylan 1,4-beta-xylosidase